MATTPVVPVDLSVFLFEMELDIALAFIMEICGDKNGSERFVKASEARQKAFAAVFWNEGGQWLDYWLSSSGDAPETCKAENQNTNVFASNFQSGSVPSTQMKILSKEVVKALENSGLIAPAGILTSLTNSGQQWAREIRSEASKRDSRGDCNEMDQK
ncbi:hypothetical protein Bca101_084043 [Brassica carinata]